MKKVFKETVTDNLGLTMTSAVAAFVDDDLLMTEAATSGIENVLLMTQADRSKVIASCKEIARGDAVQDYLKRWFEKNPDASKEATEIILIEVLNFLMATENLLKGARVRSPDTFDKIFSAGVVGTTMFATKGDSVSIDQDLNFRINDNEVKKDQVGPTFRLTWNGSTARLDDHDFDSYAMLFTDDHAKDVLKPHKIN